MIIEKNDTETIIKPTQESISEFFTDFTKKYSNFSADNLVIDFSALKGTNTENILQFKEHSKTHNSNNVSFVIVASDVDYDSFEDEIMVVPTLTEAKDIIEMEIIERDLGF